MPCPAGALVAVEASNACILTPCGCRGVVNRMEIQQSVLGCMLALRIGAKSSFPEDFLEIS